jgi:hypothetical protein
MLIRQGAFTDNVISSRPRYQRAALLSSARSETPVLVFLRGPMRIADQSQMRVPTRRLPESNLTRSTPRCSDFGTRTRNLPPLPFCLSPSNVRTGFELSDARDFFAKLSQRARSILLIVSAGTGSRSQSIAQLLGELRRKHLTNFAYRLAYTFILNCRERISLQIHDQIESKKLKQKYLGYSQV